MDCTLPGTAGRRKAPGLPAGGRVAWLASPEGDRGRVLSRGYIWPFPARLRPSILADRGRTERPIHEGEDLGNPQLPSEGSNRTAAKRFLAAWNRPAVFFRKTSEEDA